MNSTNHSQPNSDMNEATERTNLATAFAAIAMTVYLWLQLAQVVLPPMV